MKLFIFYSLTSIYRANIYWGPPFTNPNTGFMSKIVWMIILITVPLYIMPSPESQGKWRFYCMVFKIRESDLAIEYMEFAFYLSHFTSLPILQFKNLNPNSFNFRQECRIH